MKVELIAYTQGCKPDNDTQNPLGVVEQCASVCYDSKPTKSFAIAKHCAKSGHHSVFEHISFTVHITGVSRALLAQFTRHRLHSFSVRSQRYCTEDGFDIVIPNTIVNGIHNEEEVFRDIIEQDAIKYRAFQALGIPNEDARYILPNACCTEMYVTANARAWIESANLRLCNRAQWEIRQLYIAIRDEIKKVCPEVASMMKPNCEVNESCPMCTEEKSCGKHPTKQEVYDGYMKMKHLEAFGRLAMNGKK